MKRPVFNGYLTLLIGHAFLKLFSMGKYVFIKEIKMK